LSIFPLSPEINDEFITDLNIKYRWNGESWIFIPDSRGILTVTSETRPFEPDEGLVIYETDTDQVLVWNGSEWAEISGGGATVAFQEEQPDVTDLEPGTLWVDSDRPAVNGLMAQTFLRWIKTLSASASEFSGSDDDLYLNGTLLVRGDDYTATDGLIITLEEAASDGDVLEIHAFEPFSLTNHYTKAASDAKYMPSSAVFLENWAEDEEGNLLPSEDSTFSIGSEDYKVKDLYLSASSLYLEDPSNPGQTIALSVDSEGSLKVGDSKLITESNANDTLDTSFLLNLIYPIGSIYTNATNSTNPGTLLGFGTWSAFGSGKVPVGFDSADSDFNSAEKTGGAKTHTLTTAEIPSHTHTQNAHSHTPTIQMGFGAGSLGSGWARVDTNNPANPWGNVSIASTTATNQNTGGGGAHNILQPYITVYMWKRTA
jgi:hypothetical protein